MCACESMSSPFYGIDKSWLGGSNNNIYDEGLRGPLAIHKDR